jgi:uncharacterized membrane protein YbhN (UPF0104 family)
MVRYLRLFVCLFLSGFFCLTSTSYASKAPLESTILNINHVINVSDMTALSKNADTGTVIKLARNRPSGKRLRLRKRR